LGSVFLSLGFMADVSARELAAAGQPAAVIVVNSRDTIPAEKTAAAELAAYLGKITGAAFEIVEEEQFAGGAAIYLGWTSFAKSQGVDFSVFGEEEWLLRTTGNSLIVGGGRPRGTLYAVYRFLEDYCGVRWWSLFEEHVPVRADLAVPSVNAQGRPAFEHRTICTRMGRAGGSPNPYWRNRLHSDPPIPPELGAIPLRYAVPRGANFVHSNGFYISADRYFDRHPEWFAAADAEGKTRLRNGQLCLTNMEMRREYLANLLAAIEEIHEAAAKEGHDPALVFDISQNDHERYCRCAACSAIAAEEESQAGPIVDFSNWLADQVAQRYPDVTLSTLAYMYSEVPPKTLVPRSNLAIRLCDTISNFLLPITAEENALFKSKFDGWAAKASSAGIHLWKYGRTYSSVVAPTPNLRALHADFRYYHDHGVRHLFFEHEVSLPEDPAPTDMWEYKNWMVCKFMEDPTSDFDRLRADFCHGFYKAAGGIMIEYLDLLDRQAAATKSWCHWQTSPAELAYLDQQFYDKAQSLFDEAELLVADDTTAFRRVREARIVLDRSQLHLAASGRIRADRLALATRYRDAWADSLLVGGCMRLRYLIYRDAEKIAGENFFSSAPVDIPGLDGGDEVQWRHSMVNASHVIADGEAATGHAAIWRISDMDDAKYRMPMPLGIYSKSGRIDITLRAEDLRSPGYHWYLIGKGPIYEDSYVWVGWPWLLQTPVGSARNRDNPEQEYEIWVRLKFTGPKFLGAESLGQNAVFKEMAVLVSKAEGGLKQERD